MVLAVVRGELRPHDLLRLRDPMNIPSSAPDWVRASLARSEWVVVRRAKTQFSRVAVGVRGPDRNQRWGTTVSVTEIIERVTPEQLAYRVDCQQPELPAMRALQILRQRLQTIPVRWGPTGSVGFELASGLSVIHCHSDVDIVVRFRRPAQRRLLSRLHGETQNLPARVDAQLDFDFGAVALDELMSGAHHVLVKSSAGPMLMPADACWRRP